MKTTRQILLREYANWQKFNFLNQAKFITQLGFFVHTFMIIFDYFWLVDPTYVIGGRFANLLVLALNFLVIRSIEKANNLISPFAKSALMLIPVFCYALTYHFYLHILSDTKFLIYFAGTIMGVFVSSFILHRFWRQQYIYNIAGIFIALAIIPFAPKDKIDFLSIVVIAHLAFGFVSFYFRREFVGNLFAKYTLLSTMVPERIASLLLVSDEKVDITALFRPKDRFTVCVCADWRDFQDLCQNRTSDEISALLEKFYDIIIETLERVSPDNNYYFNWTADELFVIFFNDNDKREEVIKEALEFVQNLATDLYQRIHSEVDHLLNYDIGISVGIGLLGLQGPQRMKKTTIAGAVAGRAKRLESEAKNLRKTMNANCPPLLVMEEALYHFSNTFDFFRAGSFREILGTAKNIENQRLYVWLTEQNNEKAKIVNLKKHTG